MNDHRLLGDPIIGLLNRLRTIFNHIDKPIILILDLDLTLVTTISA